MFLFTKQPEESFKFSILFQHSILKTQNFPGNMHSATFNERIYFSNKKRETSNQSPLKKRDFPVLIEQLI